MAAPSQAPANGRINRTGDMSIIVNWDVLPGATTYAIGAVEWNNPGVPVGGIITVIGTTSTISFSHTFTALDKRYFIRLQARNADGNGPWGDPIPTEFYTKPLAPRRGTITPITPSIIEVDFPPVSSFPIGLRVGRSNGTTVDINNGGVLTQWPVPADLVVRNFRDNQRVPGMTYRARTMVGVVGTPGRNFSDWTEWSDPVSDWTPPNAPTVTAPNQGGVGLTPPVTFRWIHNSTDLTSQQAAEIEWRKRGSSTSWNAITGITFNQFFTPSEAQWTTIKAAGPEIEYRIRTRGFAADFSPWSATRFFAIMNPPLVSITSPHAGETLDTSTLVLSWTFFQQEGLPQSGYRPVLKKGASTLYDQILTGQQSTFTFPVSLENNSTYQVELSAFSNDIWSAVHAITIYTLFVPPNTPLLRGSWDESQGGHSLEIQARPSTIGASETSTLTIMRSLDGGSTWDTVLANIDAGQALSPLWLGLQDNKGLSVGETHYRVTAFSALGAQAQSAILIIDARSLSTWIGEEPGFIPIRLPYNHKSSIDMGRERSSETYDSRSLPVAYSGPALTYVVDSGGTIYASKYCDDQLMIEDPCGLSATRAALREIAQAQGPIFLYRDADGEYLYGVISNIHLTRVKMDVWDWGFSITEAEYIRLGIMPTEGEEE